MANSAQHQHTDKMTFDEALSAYRRHIDAGTDDSAVARKLWMRVMITAPPEFLALAQSMAHEEGLLPTRPSGYVGDEPVYSTRDIAAHLGVSLDKVNATVAEIEEMATDRPGAVIHVDLAGVARIH